MTDRVDRRHRTPDVAPPGRRRRRWIVGLGVTLVLLVVAAGYLGWHARKAQAAIGVATTEVDVLQQQLRDGDVEPAAATLGRLQTATSAAVDHMSVPGWALVAHAPLVGDDVEAVRVAADSVDDIAQRALPPLVADTDSLDPALFRPKDGRLDVDRLAEIAPGIIEASRVLTANDERLSTIDRTGLVGPLQGPIGTLLDEVRSASRTAGAAAKAAAVLPGMLGQDGARTYALAIQNNAEVRATGGIPGAVALVKVDDGRIELDRQLSTADFDAVPEPVVELTKDEISTFGNAVATDIRDSTLTPHFPRSAQIIRALVDRQADTKVDGVISVDPVALSYVLRGTGPIEAPDGGELTSDNAVELLLNTVYARYSDSADQDSFFAGSAASVFERIVDGQGDPAVTLRELRRATDENRIMVWSADQTEEKVLASSGVGGTFPVDTDRPDVGVYLADITSSKMQFYLDARTRVTATGCVDGRQRLTVTTTLRSKAPSDSALLPEYIVGLGVRAPLGSMRLRVYTFAPVGGRVETFEIDGERRGGNTARLGGRPGERHVVLLPPGETVTLTSTMTSGPDQRGRIRLSTTPGLASLPNDVAVASACS